MEYLANLLILTLGLIVCIGGAVALIVALPTLIEFQIRKNHEKFS
jgi:hypothetical protein